MDLTTTYLGLSLRSPLVIGASPLADHVDGAKRLEDAGAAAIVLRSLFEEQITVRERALLRRNGQAHFRAGGWGEAVQPLFSPREYLRHISRLKRKLAIPVIASLNGHQPGGWVGFASDLALAGADAIEINFYQVVTDPAVAADQVEVGMLEAVGALVNRVSVPVAVKLSPYHAAVAQLAVALELAGAAGLTLFNRFYQPDVNTDLIGVQPILRLSEPGELLLRLRWLAILSPLLRGSLAATGGVHTPRAVVKALLTGAHAVQLVSLVLAHGEKAIGELERGLAAWMREHGYSRIDDFRGLLNQERCADPMAYERANYLRVLHSWAE